MEELSCATCLKPKAALNCDVCGDAVCKKCAQFLGEDSFPFLPDPPECLSHRVYCKSCFDENVQPELDNYNKIMEAAKGIVVFSKTQGKETRSFSRKENLFQVTDCTDQKEAVLRLAFLAAKAEFNAIIDLELTSRKVRDGGYQHLLWSATARPTNVAQGYRE